MATKGTTALCVSCFNKAVREVVENHWERKREANMYKGSDMMPEVWALVGHPQDAETIQRWLKLAEGKEISNDSETSEAGSLWKPGDSGFGYHSTERVVTGGNAGGSTISQADKSVN
jgi:hypothetical protein